MSNKYIEKIVIASFDIGLQNFSIYVESVSSKELKELQKRFFSLPKSNRKFQLNEYTKDIVDDLLKCGQTLHLSVDSLSKKTKYSNTVRLLVIEYLKKHDYILSLCDICVIEQQYTKRRSTNYTAMKIAEVTATYLQTKYPRIIVFDFPSRFKTFCFGSTAKTKSERKSFTVEYAETIFKLKQDELQSIYTLARNIKRKRKNREEYLIPFEKSQPFVKELARKIVSSHQKLDDISDAFVQCQAFKFKVLIANTNL